MSSPTDPIIRPMVLQTKIGMDINTLKNVMYKFGVSNLVKPQDSLEHLWMEFFVGLVSRDFEAWKEIHKVGFGSDKSDAKYCLEGPLKDKLVSWVKKDKKFKKKLYILEFYQSLSDFQATKLRGDPVEALTNFVTFYDQINAKVLKSFIGKDLLDLGLDDCYIKAKVYVKSTKTTKKKNSKSKKKKVVTKGRVRSNANVNLE